MVKLHFDATTGAIDWKAAYPEPRDLAAFLWESEPEHTTFELACEFARTDPDAYDIVIKALRAGHRVSDAVKVRLFPALVGGRPRKGVAATQYRDNRLRAAAGLLCRVYGIAATRNPASTALCAAGILADLPDTPSEHTIANILRPQK